MCCSANEKWQSVNTENTDVTLLNAFFFCSNFALLLSFLLFLLTICSFRIKVIILQLNFKNQENRMKQNNSNLLYHLVAFITVAIWGTTFVSTKVLMLNGLSPAQIFTLRFSIAYIMMLMVNHKRMFADSWKDEFKMAMLGITGGSLYFLSENEAMNYTTTTNTSLIVCSCPLFATLLVRLVYRHSSRINMIQLLGSLLAFVGMIIVVLNGRFVLHLSPVGDALALRHV